MVATFEPIVFTVEESAKLAQCDAYCLLSLAVEKGVHVYTYLPANSMAVSVDRRYVQGEWMLSSISEVSLRLSRPTSVRCMTGLLLDESDCREVVRQKKFSRTFFERGVVITSKDSPTEIHASDHGELFLACVPPPNDDPAVAMDPYLDFETTEPLKPPPWMMGPHRRHEVPQFYFGAYPAGLDVEPDYAQLRLPRPQEVVLHPDNLFLLKDGIEQLGLLSSKGSRQANEDTFQAENGSTASADSLATTLIAEESKVGGAGRAEEMVADESTDSPAEEVVIVQFADIQIQDYWSFWLKELIKIARQEWSNRRRDHGFLGDEERNRTRKDLLSRNRDHEGRKLRVDELTECVTLMTPLWARHWVSPNLRDMSPPGPVTAELQKMIAVAEKIQEFKEEGTGSLTKVRVREWLRSGGGHSFSEAKSDLVANLLLDFPKKAGKTKPSKV